MADKFMVLNILNRSSTIMNFEDICKTYPESNLTLLKEGAISVVSIYKDGKKIALINRMKEGSSNE